MRYAAALCVVLAAGTAAGRDVLVNNLAGDDASSGERWENGPDRTGPVRTLGRALRLAQSGDHVVLAQTGIPYREDISLVGSRHSGSVYQPFTLDGNGQTLDGSLAIGPRDWEHFAGAVFCYRTPEGGPQQLYLNGRPAPLVPAPLGAIAPPPLKPLEWSLVAGTIYFCVEPDKLPRSYALSRAGGATGITLYHVRHAIIRNLTVQGFRIDGVAAFNSARMVRLDNVVLRGNGRAGVSAGGATLIGIDRSLAGDNAHAQLLTLAYSETHLDDTELRGLTAPGWVDHGGRLYAGGERLLGGRDVLLGD